MSVAPASSVRIDRLRRSVADLARSTDFYRGALGFVATRQDPRSVRLRLGEQEIELLWHTGPAPLPPGAVAPDPRFQHAAIATSDMDAAWRRLEAHGAVAISRGGPQRLPANTGGVSAFKFRDPDGHPLELIHFPPGIGDPRWQRPNPDGPTLGIDHFALVVRSVDASVAWLAERLDFRVASRGVNRGVEQDRLDGLDGVEVDVVALAPRAAPGTPHLELLHYRRPAAELPLAATALDRTGADVLVCVAEHPAGWQRIEDADGHAFMQDAVGSGAGSDRVPRPDLQGR